MDCQNHVQSISITLAIYKALQLFSISNEIIFSIKNKNYDWSYVFMFDNDFIISIVSEGSAIYQTSHMDNILHSANNLVIENV